MAGWRSKTQFQNLCDELSQCESKAFERCVLSYLRLTYPHAVQIQALGSVDRAGIDILVPNADTGSKIGVQCKGFLVTESELGKSQITQCCRSIATFDKSNFQIDEYWLVYNRAGHSPSFRAAIQDRLGALVSTGRVKSACLMSRDTFLHAILERLFTQFHAFLAARTRMFHECSDFLGNPEYTILGAPYEVGTATLSALGLKENDDRVSRFRDPTLELCGRTKKTSPQISFILAEFGMGKTTQAFRAAESSQHLVLYVPASSFPASIANSSDLLFHFTGADSFLDTLKITDADEHIHTRLRRLLILMADKLLLQNNNKYQLVIDGLDEAPFIASGHALPLLFDALSNIGARTTLTMRSEFWEANKESLLTGYLARVKPPGNIVRNRSFKILRLTKWRNNEISELIYNSCVVETNSRFRNNLLALDSLIKSQAESGLYGDIPRRPLFLRMLIEYVKENGVGDISLADLFERWIDMKIRRDLVMPRTHGGPSREGISSSIKTPDLIRHYSVRCMKTAARLMTSVENGHLVLLPNCEFDQISLLELRGHEDMTGLVLNSLLMPDTMVSQRTVRFAHRAFQEYFLASCIKEQNLFTSIILPEQIEIWLRRLHAKGILSG